MYVFHLLCITSNENALVSQTRTENDKVITINFKIVRKINNVTFTRILKTFTIMGKSVLIFLFKRFAFTCISKIILR